MAQIDFFEEGGRMATAARPIDQSIDRPGYGWVSFAGIMLILVGFFNMIDGIAAIANSNYIANQLLFANLDAWGWFFLIWGVLQVCAGFALFAGAGWAVWVGVLTAFVNAFSQL